MRMLSVIEDLALPARYGDFCRPSTRTGNCPPAHSIRHILRIRNMKLTQSRLSLLQNLANNGGSILWHSIGSVGKTASAYLRMHGLAEMVEPSGSTFQPRARKLQITAAGLAAIGK